MNKFNMKDSMQKGSLMVEALALLGLITMVTPILYKKSAERTTELQDINVATQMRMLSSAVDDYVKDNYQQIGEDHAGEDKWELSGSDLTKLEEYLPHGFNLSGSKLFDQFSVAIKKAEVLDKNNKVHNIYTSAVLAPLKEDLSMMRTSKIASMIGANGGVYKQGNEETGTPSVLSGVQGTWQANYGDYFDGEETGLSDGSLVIVSSEAISSAKGDASSEDVLYRVSDGDDSKNTMQTTLLMGGNPIRQITNLIASSGGSVTIGKDAAETSDLLVTGVTNLEGLLTARNGVDVTDGDVDIAKNLNVDENTKLKGTLDVEGSTTLVKTDVHGDFTQDTGSVSLAPSIFSLNSSGAVDINGSSVEVDGTTVDVRGSTSASLTAAGNGLTVKADGNHFTGDTFFENITGDTITAKVKFQSGENGNFTADSEGNIESNTLLVRGNLQVHEESGKSVTRVIGDEFTVHNNLVATEDATYVAKDSFAVGGSVDEGNNRINVNSDSAFIGFSYATGGSHEGLLVESGKLVMRNAVGNLKMADSVVVLDNNSSRMKMDGESVVIGVGTEDSEKAKIIANPTKVGFETVGASEQGSLYLEDNMLKFASGDNSLGILADEYGVAFGEDISTSLERAVDVDGGIESKLITGTDSGRKVAISRKGIIEIAPPSGVDDDGGFIRARRLVSDIKYPEGDAYHGFKADGGTLSKAYDYYQVNPAYTSVMNDIKLAARGGARLSDILPDFINKGIYVVDNTYSDAAVGDNYPKYADIDKNNGWVPAASYDCADTSCIASPWMGMIPAPQCPKNYAKVVTISPFRWRMSEVFSVWPDSDFQSASTKGTAYQEMIGDNFWTYFFQQRDPKKAGFTLSTQSEGEHTHIVDTGQPVTFQTNTFLNTAMEPEFSDNTEDPSKLLGWHAFMGFLYRPQHYEEFLVDYFNKSASELGDNVYWNVFPVYAQDMAGIANVYCAFERSRTNSPWGDEVYQYDQIEHFSSGFVKDQYWSGAVNDPELGYDDAW